MRSTPLSQTHTQPGVIPGLPSSASYVPSGYRSAPLCSLAVLRADVSTVGTFPADLFSSRSCPTPSPKSTSAHP